MKEDKFIKIPEEYKVVLQLMAEYIGNETNDWITIKSELRKLVSKNKGKLLSTRHYVTFLQIPNEFDYLIMDYWEYLTGIKLIIPKEKLHSESGWIWRPKNWGLMEFNKKKSEEKRERELRNKKNNK